MKSNSLLIVVVSLVLSAASLHAQISVTANGNSIGMYDVYELTIQHNQSYPNNWEDVTVSTMFSGPQTMNISGFFYNTNIWKVRFAPPKTGSWTWAMTFKTPTNTYTANGSFACVTSNTKGFLQQHPKDPFRLIYPDGALFNGIGIEDCMSFYPPNSPTPIDSFGFDGDFRVAGIPPRGWNTDRSTYFNAYGKNGAGFNLFRWTVNNCSFNLYNKIDTAGNDYKIQEGLYGDTLVETLRQNGFRIFLTMFGVPPYSNLNGSIPKEDSAIERYINYVVARYGAYTDIWELMNESTPTDYWINTMAAYLNSIDPYNRLISTSYQRPDLASIAVNSPHWYEKESEFASDQRSWDEITNIKSYNKPIIFGEQGNSVQNWDSLSALRMRLRSWTAFFAEGMFIFWNSSFAKDYLTSVAANIYLGPTERGYIRAMQDFTSLPDSSLRQMSITPSNPSAVRAYGLVSSQLIMGYFHHYSSHTTSITTSFNLTLPQVGTIYWVNPADNTIIQSAPIGIGAQTITSPAFTIDLAMRIELGTSTGIYNVNTKMDIRVYPNPAINEIKIDFNGNENNLTEIRMVNVLGIVVKKWMVFPSQFMTIDLNELSAGVYQLVFQNPNGIQTKKLLITK